MLLHVFLNAIAFVIALGVLITIHEYGHFLAARFFKVKIERFSIGFGPVLWSWKDSEGTEYIISAILLGGYVKLLNIPIKEIKNDEKYDNIFNYIHIWKRSIIIAAGPIFNFIFSVLLYTLVFIIGVPIYKPIINYILPNSIIDQSKISIGSQIKSINDIQIYDWESLRLNILNNINQEKITISTELINDNNIDFKIHVIRLPINWFNKPMIETKNPIIALGMFPNILRLTSIISERELYFFDKQDNLKINDKILLIDDQPIFHWESFVKTIKNNPKKTFRMVIERNKQLLYLNFKLYENSLSNLEEIKNNINLFFKTIVISTAQSPEIHRYGLYDAIVNAFHKTWDFMCLITNTLFQLIFGNISIVNLHGPIAIAKGAGKSAHAGIIYYLIFLSMISINLGIINLLPLPILDGGQLIFLLIEKLKGRPISQKTQNFSYIISFIILTLIMFFAVYNDITT